MILFLITFATFLSTFAWLARFGEKIVRREQGFFIELFMYALGLSVEWAVLINLLNT